MRGKGSVDRSSIKSAERALAILEYLEMTRNQATVTELCEVLNIPQSSMSMLMNCLSSLGYVQKLEGERAYVLGMRAAFLGNWAQRLLGSRNPLCELADDIAREVNETVVIATQNGPYVQYVYVTSRKKPEEIKPRVGTKRPMACTAAGRSLLSRLEAGTVRRIARRNNAEAQPRHQVSELKLLDLINQERTQGFFESRGGYIEGINSLTVLLGDPMNNTQLVLGVGGPDGHMMDIRNNVIDILTTVARDRAGEADTRGQFAAEESASLVRTLN